mmetsp:Transcript_5442/g.7131  ORF Transcript_5442/g.7131 Transcript_5442/m.7131 type:complete len:367 (+) Transcript_5442:104-1204(+)
MVFIHHTRRDSRDPASSRNRQMSIFFRRRWLQVLFTCVATFFLAITATTVDSANNDKISNKNSKSVSTTTTATVRNNDNNNDPGRTTPLLLGLERWERLENNVGVVKLNDDDCNQEKTESKPASSSCSNKQQTCCCRFFLWNVPSSICYHLSNKLRRERTTEGRGGIKYVRIEQRGLLNHLWPCSRFKADSCMICGNSLREHLLLNWSTLGCRNTPFDNHLDQTFQKGTKNNNQQASTRQRTGKKGQTTGTTKERGENVFHRIYVKDKNDDSIGTASSSRGVFNFGSSSKSKKDTTAATTSSSRYGKNNDDDSNQVVWRKCEGVSYTSPRVDQFRNPLALNLACGIVIIKLERLIGIEAVENMKDG